MAHQTAGTRPAAGHQESMQEEATHMLEECRMVLPGIQTLMGFQLIVAFNPAFQDLDLAPQLVHLGALMMTGIAIALLMAPAAFHRVAQPGRITRDFIDLTSRYLAAGLLPLSLGITADVFLVVYVVTELYSAAAAAGALLWALYTWLWFMFPLGRADSKRS